MYSVMYKNLVQFDDIDVMSVNLSSVDLRGPLFYWLGYIRLYSGKYLLIGQFLLFSLWIKRGSSISQVRGDQLVCS